MGSDVEIRRLNQSDWYPLEGFIRDAREALNRDLDGAIELTYQLWTGSDVYVAMDGRARMAGLVALTPGRKDSDGHIAQLRIHVRPKYRGDGLGSRLLKAAIEYADATGIRRIVATPYMGEGWAAKERFFRRHGFLLEGMQTYGARLLDGTLVDTGLFARTTLPARQ
jgi:GNAT superfamily N-acetyltransferase